jgi:hypothetical protein
MITYISSKLSSSIVYKKQDFNVFEPREYYSLKNWNKAFIKKQVFGDRYF